MKIRLLSILLAAVMINANTTLAKGKWTYEVTPYIWAATMDGTLVTGNGFPSLGITGDFEDMFANMDGGGGLTFEAYDNDNVVFFEFSALDLGQKVVSGTRTLELEQSNLMGTGLWGVKVQKYVPLDVLFGARLWDVQTDIGVGGAYIKQTDSWVDAMLGVRGTVPLSEKTSLDLSGLLGFGAESIEWELLAVLDTKINEKYSWKVGCRALGVDYSQNTYEYDVTQYGWVLGLDAYF